ncbi:hypothetical protein D9M70_576330 [compost metagenome]
MGLVPNSGLVPPAGATQAWLGVKARATSPCSVRGSISGQRAEKCTQRLIARMAMPWLRAFSTSSGRPAWKAHWAKAPWASTRTTEGAVSKTSGSAVGETLPAFSVPMQPGKRYTPWLVQPSRSPATMVAATACTWGSLKP